MKVRSELRMAAALALACIVPAQPVLASVLTYDVAFVVAAGSPELQGWFSVDDVDPLEPIFGNVAARTFVDFRFSTAAGEVFDANDAPSFDRAFYLDGLIAGLDVLVDDQAAPLGEGAILDIATGFDCQGLVCTVVGSMWALRSDREDGEGSYRFTLRVPEPASIMLAGLGLLMMARAQPRSRGRLLSIAVSYSGAHLSRSHARCSRSSNGDRVALTRR